MSKANHTPGPWHVASREGKYYGTDVLADDGRVCECWTHDAGDCEPSERELERIFPPGGHPLTEQEKQEALSEYLCDSHYETARDLANARLISAAPDLLTAAKMALDCAQSLNEEMTAAYAALRAAVAKAEGNQQEKAP